MKTTSQKIEYMGAVYPIVSQDVSVADPMTRKYAECYYLPELVRLWAAVEKTTGYRWHSTSYWRDSPSHVTGQALDIAPEIAPSSKALYGIYAGTDPVLFLREKLMRSLQRVAKLDFPSDYLYIIAVETDHLHLHLFQPEPGMDQNVRVIKWKVRKPVYPDTDAKQSLPMLRAGDSWI